jgi:predicted DNA-binding transcriptional regulator AlpA
MTTASCIRRPPEICRVNGLGHSMLYQLQAEKQFPQRMNLIGRAVSWSEHEARAWLVERIAQSRAHPDPSAGAPDLERIQQRAGQRGR